MGTYLAQDRLGAWVCGNWPGAAVDWDPEFMDSVWCLGL